MAKQDNKTTPPNLDISGSKSSKDKNPAQPSSDLLSLATPPNSAGPLPPITHPDTTVIQQIRQDRNDRNATQPAGFSYAGNNCYRNAILVLLLNSAPFMNYVGNRHENTIRAQHFAENPEIKPDYTDLLLQLGILYHSYWSKPDNTNRNKVANALTAFWRHLTDKAKVQAKFRSGREHDAEEFLLWLLQEIEEIFSTYVFLASDGTDFTALYKLSSVDRRRCYGCHSVNNVKHRLKQEPENIWKVAMDVLDPKTGAEVSKTEFKLGELLDGFLKKDGSSWYCSQCTSDGKKRAPDNRADWIWRRFLSAPELVLMQIMRFRHKRGDIAGGAKVSKDNRFVEIPETFDMRPYLHASVLSKDPNMLTQYRLRSVVMHQGEGKESGSHYINYVRGDDNKWWAVDGTTVTPATFSDINLRPQVGSTKVNTPYILSWEKIVNIKPPPAPAHQPQASSSAEKSTQFPEQNHSNNALLHVNLKIGGQSYNFTDDIPNWDPTHVDAIRDEKRPLIECDATIELPDKSSDPNSTSQPANNPYILVPNTTRFLHLDPAITRGHLLSTDLHTSIKRPTVKPTVKTEKNQPPVRRSSRLIEKENTKKRSCPTPPCITHCPPPPLPPQGNDAQQPPTKKRKTAAAAAAGSTTSKPTANPATQSTATTTRKPRTKPAAKPASMTGSSNPAAVIKVYLSP